MLKARLNLKFYIVTALMLCLVIFVWYGIYFLNTNEILMEDDQPMDASTKALFSVLLSAVSVTWTLSLFTLIRQMVSGCAFYMNESGIHTTATAIIVFSLILVVPVKRIPYEAIEQITEENGSLTIKIDKSKIDVSPVLRLFVRKQYHFFSGFTKEKQSDIKQMLNQLAKYN